MSKESLSTSIWLALFTILPGAGAMFASHFEYNKAVEAASWIQKKAVITKNIFDQRRGKSDTTLYLRAKVRGQTEDHKVRVSYGNFSTRSNFESDSKKYPVGKKVIVYQNPKDKSQMVLRINSDLNWLKYVFGAGAALIILGVKILISGARKRKI